MVAFILFAFLFCSEEELGAVAPSRSENCMRRTSVRTLSQYDHLMAKLEGFLERAEDPSSGVSRTDSLMLYGVIERMHALLGSYLPADEVEPADGSVDDALSRFTSQTGKIVNKEGRGPKQQITKESMGSFFSNYMIDLPSSLHVCARNSVEYLVGMGLTPRILSQWYERYRPMLEQDNILDVSTGAGDCQLRSLLSWDLINRVRSHHELSEVERSLIALCGFLFEFAERRGGKNSILGCLVSEPLKVLPCGKFPSLDPCLKKAPLNPNKPDSFFANIKNLVTLQTLALVFNEEIHTLDFSFSKISGMQIPTISHARSFSCFLGKLASREIPYFVTLMHFNRKDGDIFARYELVDPCKRQVGAETFCVNFDFYTVNYDADLQSDLYHQMETQSGFQEIFRRCGADVDAENSILSSSRSTKQFGKEVLLARLRESCKRMCVFHVSTKKFEDITGVIKFNNAQLARANFSDL